MSDKHDAKMCLAGRISDGDFGTGAAPPPGAALSNTMPASPTLMPASPAPTSAIPAPTPALPAPAAVEPQAPTGIDHQAAQPDDEGHPDTRGKNTTDDHSGRPKEPQEVVATADSAPPGAAAPPYCLIDHLVETHPQTTSVAASGISWSFSVFVLSLMFCLGLVVCEQESPSHLIKGTALVDNASNLASKFSSIDPYLYAIFIFGLICAYYVLRYMVGLTWGLIFRRRYSQITNGISQEYFDDALKLSLLETQINFGLMIASERDHPILEDHAPNPLNAGIGNNNNVAAAIKVAKKIAPVSAKNQPFEEM